MTPIPGIAVAVLLGLLMPRWRVASLVIGVGVVAVGPWPLLILAMALPAQQMTLLARTKSIGERQVQQLPDALDLLALGAASGVGVAGSLDLIHGYGPSAVSLRVEPVMAAIASGRPVASALESSGVERSDPLGIVLAALQDSHHEGVPIEGRLERLAADLRRIARSREQVMARKLSVRLLIPLIVCMLPAFALLTVVPVLNEALG